MEREVEKNGCVLNGDGIGTIKIANDVVSMIASLAAAEVDGVSALTGIVSKEFMSKVGMKKHAKGVKVEIIEKNVSVDIAVNLQYGFNIPATCSKVQEKIKNAIETMTGLEVVDVNIRIVGIQMNDK